MAYLPVWQSSINRKESPANTVLCDLLHRELSEIIGCSANSLQLPLPQSGEINAEDGPFRVFERDSYIGVSRDIGGTVFLGRALLVIDREIAIDWFFDALSSGSFDGSVASRFLSRNALMGRLQLEVSRSRRYANPLSCLVIRIDFAEVETKKQRHTVHDLIAATLTEQLRWVDVLGQWSVRALVVILPETTETAASRLASKVTKALHPRLEQDAPAVSIHVGASSWCKGDDAEQLMRRADISARRQNGSTARTLSF